MVDGNNVDDNDERMRDDESSLADRNLVMSRFLKLAQEKFSSSGEVKRLDELYNQNPDYQPEKDLLMKMNNNGLGKGIVLGVFTFFSFTKRSSLFSKIHVATTTSNFYYYYY